MASQASPKPTLLQVVRLTLRRRHYSYRTEQSYLHWIQRFVRFHNRRHPREMGAAEVTAFLMGAPEVTAFLNHLASERRVAAATQNQALSALLFLYPRRRQFGPLRHRLKFSGEQQRKVLTMHTA